MEEEEEEKEEEEPVIEKAVINFSGTKGADEVDQLLSNYIDTTSENLGGLEIKKLDKPGQYMFGHKKVMAKVSNGKLIVRVGGGWMPIEDFIKYYVENELAKHKKTEKELLVREEGAGPAKGRRSTIAQVQRDKGEKISPSKFSTMKESNSAEKLGKTQTQHH